MARRKAKTAYELLERVCEMIEQEPWRYFQTVWAVIGKTKVVAWAKELVRNKPTNPKRTNECNTIGCRAGLIVLAHDGVMKTRAARRAPDGDRGFFYRNRAVEILGLREYQTMDLFDANACVGTRPGSRAHAKAGVAGLRAFMATHEAHLKARSLEGV